MKHLLLIISIVLNIALAISLVTTKSHMDYTLYQEWAETTEDNIRVQKSFLQLLTDRDPNSLALLEQVLKNNIQNNEKALEAFRSASVPDGVMP
jgi:hypothetical protein